MLELELLALDSDVPELLLLELLLLDALDNDVPEDKLLELDSVLELLDALDSDDVDERLDRLDSEELLDDKLLELLDSS